MRFLLIKNGDNSLQVLSPEVYGLDTWGSSSQESLEYKETKNKWVIHYWSDGGQWLEDTNEDIDLDVVLETTDFEEVIGYVRKYEPEYLQVCMVELKDLIVEYIDYSKFCYGFDK